MFHRAIACIAVPAFLALGCADGTDSQSAAPAMPAEPAAPSASEVLDDVVAAMGTASLNSVTYSGRAWRIRNGWMQTPHADPPWPYRDEITNYRRTIDLGQPASLAMGDTFAQNLFLDPPVAGTYTQNIPADATAWPRQLEIWLTPWGFLKGAADNGVELSTASLDGVEYRVLSWMSPEDQTSPSGMRYTVNGYINDANLVAGVETWVEDAFMGDFHVRQVYRDYRGLNGLMVPQTIEQQRGGGGVFGVIITDVTGNPSNLSELMVAPQGGGGGFGGGGGQAPTDIVEQVGDGVWLITGGYIALVAEFEDYLMVFEAGQSEARGEQILEAVTGLNPDKPIRFLVNSHPHSDHTAGIVPFIRNGAALITHANNAAFLDMALSTPRTLLGEETLQPDVVGVDGITVYEDSLNRVELHSVPNGHTDGMLVAILPRQGILFQADFTLPQPGAEANPFVVTLAQYVAEVDPQFERYLAVHAAQVPQTKADLLATIGL
ncbi:MAG TPA: MBL fold metallo-hydrolase [Gammaproteobacteria bacterium]|jgi:glyoxylase-like metal-dependent hydrolase (beta-lactamase superfamily II)